MEEEQFFKKLFSVIIISCDTSIFTLRLLYVYYEKANEIDQDILIHPLKSLRIGFVVWKKGDKDAILKRLSKNSIGLNLN